MTEQDVPHPIEGGAGEPAASTDSDRPPRSEAQEAELAALEAMLPARNALPEAGRDGAQRGPSPGDPNPVDEHCGKADSDAG